MHTLFTPSFLFSTSFIHKNNPLFLETYGPASISSAAPAGGEDTLRFHYAVHCALDAVEERRAFLFEERPLFCQPLSLGKK